MDQHLSIQEMVKNQSFGSIPNQFLVHHQQPPLIPHTPSSSSSSSVPVVDLHALLANDRQSGDDFHTICKGWGIFQLVNHGMDAAVVEKLKRAAHEFYAMPVVDRVRYRVGPGDIEGYGQTIILSEGQQVDWADRFFIFTNPIHWRKPHLLPELPSALREAMEAYIAELQKLSMTIFGLIAKALKIDPRETEMFGDGMQSLRMNYYPPCPMPDKVIGLTPHSDACGITILLQINGVEGLQVKKDGIWLPVNILPNALVINLGDVIEILSNGLYKSIEHRAAVNSEKERISIAMFFSPKLNSLVSPSPSLLIKTGQQPLFRQMKTEHYVKDFFTHKLNGKSFLQNMKL